MTTLETLPVRVKSRKQQHFFRIEFVADDSVRYVVAPIPADPDVAVKAFSLRKEDGTVYHLRLTPEGFTDCDCPHGTFRPNSFPCRHAKMLRAAGMI